MGSQRVKHDSDDYHWLTEVKGFNYKAFPLLVLLPSPAVTSISSVCPSNKNALLNFPVKFPSQSTPRGVYPWEPGGVVYKGSAKFLQNLF